MNPQFTSQQPFNPPLQGFATNRIPSVGPQPNNNFQNVPLGPQKQAFQQNGPPGPPQMNTSQNISNPSDSQPNLFTTNAGMQGIGTRQIPPNQLPPGMNQAPPEPKFSTGLSGQFNQPGKPPMAGSQQNLQNGPPSQFTNASNPPAVLPPSQPGLPPTNQQNQNKPPPVGINQPFGQPPSGQPNSNNFSPPSQQGPQSNLLGRPPSASSQNSEQNLLDSSSSNRQGSPAQLNSQASTIPPSQAAKNALQGGMAPPPLQQQPAEQNQGNQFPPARTQQPSFGVGQAGFPPSSTPNQSIPPVTDSNANKMNQGEQSNVPGFNQSAHPGPDQNSRLPQGQGQAMPPQFPPQQRLGSTPGQPNSQLMQPGMPPAQPTMPQAQHNVPPGQSNMPPAQLNMPPAQSNMPPAQSSMPTAQPNMPPAQPNMPPSQTNMPPMQSNMPPTQSNLPPMQKPPQFFNPSQPHAGPPVSAQGPPPPGSGNLTSNQGPFSGKPKSPYQLASQGYPSVRPNPMQNNQNNQFGQPPRPGQPPLPNQFSQNSPASFGGMPPAPNQFGQPPAPGQLPPNQYNANQLAGQMQNVNLGGSRTHAGGLPGQGPTMGGGINGDTGPHMPPPLSNQPGYINGQQMRGPPRAGYPQGPPMPGAPGSNYQQPGYPQQQAGYPQQPGYPQQQQPKGLDPDQMPSPIQVIEEDEANRSGIFCTNQKGLVPPLVTTNFIVQDQGNCSPRFMRSTMYNVPISQDIMKQTAAPFSLVISPMARTLDQEYPPPIVNFGDLGPVRCIRCKAYMCPYMVFVDSGRRFQCLFCKATTDVPQEYFQHLDHTGQRVDRFERPELVLGTYEFVGTADYCKNNVLPKPPAIIFIIDVSYNNVKSGLVHLLCSQMKEIIKNLPVDAGQEKSNMKVGFITYNSSVHFYNIKGTLAAPQMMIVGDTQEMFMPLLDGFLSTPEESSAIIDALMQQIPAMFADTRETETVLLPAILAGVEALKASECTGKLMVFHSTLPIAEAPGKLKNRDDRKLLGTDKERTVLTPQTQAYNNLGQDCVSAGCAVDLFVFNNSYIDIATIGQVSRLSGGEVFKYTYFQADIDGDRLIQDIITDISRPIAFDAIMRVRTSTGIRPTEFYGHFYMQNTTDMEFGAIDCDKAVGVEIKHDDKLAEDEGVYIQAALLYTSCSGQRRLRIMNLSLKTCSQMADLYRSCDLDTIINYIAKQSVYKLLEHNPKAVKENIVNRAAQILAAYRKHCASPSSAGQLILPECMKLLPLYVNCLLKSDAISGGPDMTLDDRSFVMQAVMIMDVPTSMNYFYPRLIPIHNIDPMKDPVEVPLPIRSTVGKMSEEGVYILENGIHMFLWIGLSASPDFLRQVFGVQSAMQVEIERTKLPVLDNPLSVAVRTIIEEIRIQRHRCMRLTLVRQNEKLEHVFKHFLVEDRGTDGSASYVDFLCHMHKEIRALLS